MRAAFTIVCARIALGWRVCEQQYYRLSRNLLRLLRRRLILRVLLNLSHDVESRIRMTADGLVETALSLGGMAKLSVLSINIGDLCVCICVHTIV